MLIRISNNNNLKYNHNKINKLINFSQTPKLIITSIISNKLIIIIIIFNNSNHNGINKIKIINFDYKLQIIILINHMNYYYFQ